MEEKPAIVNTTLIKLIRLVFKDYLQDFGSNISDPVYTCHISHIQVEKWCE
jgi:hypothetical protein